MKLFLNKIFVIIITIALSSSPVIAKKIEAIYKIEFGNIDIGLINWVVDKEGDKYTTSIKLKNKGFVTGFYKFAGDYHSEGKIIDGVFISSRFKLLWKTKQKHREIKLLFSNSMLSNLEINPEEKEYPRFNFMNVKNVSDPLCSFINILSDKNTGYKTIDGRRLYRMVVEKKDMEDMIITKILIKDYLNIWADHKRNDLSYIEFKHIKSNTYNFFPNHIKIKNKGIIFKLTKI